MGDTSVVANTRPGAPSMAGSRKFVPKQYRQLMHRNSASRSPVPATQKGSPCAATCAVRCSEGCQKSRMPEAEAPAVVWYSGVRSCTAASQALVRH